MNKIVYLLGDFNINSFRSATGLNKAANDFSNLFALYFSNHSLTSQKEKLTDLQPSLIIYIQMSQILATY